MSGDMAAAGNLPASEQPNRFIRILYRVMTPFGRMQVRGLEHLDGPGGRVIVCNHVGWLDPLWVGYAAYPRSLHQMAKKELFEMPLVGWFVRSGGGFPVDRGRPGPATIKHAISLVARGERLLIFPAGTRNAGDEVDNKRGAAMIALKAGALIVPAHYDGPRRLRWGHLLWRPRIAVTFGAPLDTAAYAQGGKEATLRLTAAMEAAMKALRDAPPS